MNKLSLFNILMLVTPVIGLLVGGGATFYEWNRLQLLQAEYTRARQQIVVVDRTLAARSQGPRLTQVATVAPSPHEQTDFLTWLRVYAGLSRVRITHWANAPAPTSPDAAKAGMPASVIAINGSLEVSGDYNAIRQFLYTLERDSPRLLTLSNPTWSRSQWPQTRLAFTLTRYTAPESGGAGR